MNEDRIQANERLLEDFLAVFRSPFLITVDQCPDREKRAIAYLRSQGLHPVVSRGMAPENPGMFGSAGMRGCYENQLQVFARIADAEKPGALMFEDDVILRDDWLTIVKKALLQCPETPDLWYLGCMPGRPHEYRRVGANLLAMDRCWLNHAMYISRPGAEKLTFGLKKFLNSGKPMRQVDDHINHIDLRRYAAYPLVAVQEDGYSLTVEERKNNLNGYRESIYNVPEFISHSVRARQQSPSYAFPAFRFAIITRADRARFRRLTRMMRSVERYDPKAACAVVIYDTGLSQKQLEYLNRRFPRCEIRCADDDAPVTAETAVFHIDSAFVAMEDIKQLIPRLQGDRTGHHETKTIPDDNTQKQNLLVTLADRNFVQQARQLFSSAYWNAGWIGDYMLLACGIPEEELDWFTDKGIIVKNCEPRYTGRIGQYSAVVMTKFYLFTPEFRKWERVIFLDADIIARGSLDCLCRQKGFCACRDETPLMNQFRIADPLFDELNDGYALREKEIAFGTGTMVFTTDIITDGLFNELLSLTDRFRDILRFPEQAVLNLYFRHRWKRLPCVYNVWYEDNRDLILINYNIILHFPGMDHIAHCRPWLPENPHYGEWVFNLQRAELMNLKKIPRVKRWTRLMIFSFPLVRKMLIWYQKLLRPVHAWSNFLLDNEIQGK